MLLRRLVFRRRPLLGRLFYSLLYQNTDSQEDEILELPEPVYNYAKRISEITGLPLEEVLLSKPVQNMAKRYERKVRIRLGVH